MLQHATESGSLVYRPRWTKVMLFVVAPSAGGTKHHEGNRITWTASLYT